MSPELVAFLSSWTFEPTIVVGLLLSGALYAIGWRRMRRLAGGRGSLPPWRAWCFGGGLACVALALLSPIAVYVPLLFTMHMIQHMLLIIGAAPLIALGAPLLPHLWALPRGARRAIGGLLASRTPPGRLLGALAHPLVGLASFLGLVALWHIPAFYDAAQGRSFTHNIEHLSFLGSALLYWWALAHRGMGAHRLPDALAIPYLLLSFLEGTVIGVWLTFASAPVYATYRAAPRIWDLSAHTDQQIGGLIMWVVGGGFYLLPLLLLLYRLLTAEDRDRARRRRAAFARKGYP